MTQDFINFVLDGVEEAKKERRQQALTLARRGLAQTPMGDSDAISVPDTATPNAGSHSGAPPVQTSWQALDPS